MCVLQPAAGAVQPAEAPVAVHGLLDVLAADTRHRAAQVALQLGRHPRQGNQHHAALHRGRAQDVLLDDSISATLAPIDRRVDIRYGLKFHIQLYIHVY